jgi:glycosyltransferase involved in cell wall biosynthesis
MENNRKFKVVGVPWHVGHQFELARMSFIEQYDLIINPYRTWGTSSRPVPSNVNFVPYYEKGKYDFAILHVDQQSIYDPEHGDRIHKGKIFMELNKIIDDIPKIVINHMTPFHDNYDTPYVVEFLRKMIGDNFMIVNSHEAQKQWGWGHTVTHGLHADDWWDLPKEPRVVVSLSPAGMYKAYRREFLVAVIRELEKLGVPYAWIMNGKKCNSFDEYRDYLGRSLVYFNPTWQSPRPRSRTEAMFSGCCIVTTPYQDADTFIEDGVNGFLTSKMKDPRLMDNPVFTANLLKRLVIDEPELARSIGQEGKKTAMELFTHDKFEEQWIEVLKLVGVWRDQI